MVGKKKLLLKKPPFLFFSTEEQWWRNFSLTFLESTLKKDLETINLSSV